MNVDNQALALLAHEQDPGAPEPRRTGADAAPARIQTARAITHTIDDNSPAIEKIDALLRDRRRIEAIRVARSACSLGSREAKELIEERQLILGLRTPGVGFSFFRLFRTSN